MGRYRGFDVSTIIIELLNKLRKRDKIKGLPSIKSLFHIKFIHFNNTGEQMSDCCIEMI